MQTNVGRCLLLITAVTLSAGASPVSVPEADGAKTLRVQPNAADPTGASTGEPIHQALSRLGKSDGTVIVEAGTYFIRAPLHPHSNTTLRGLDTSQTELRLPKPTRIRRDTAAGQKSLEVARPESFLAQTTAQIVPPKVDTTFGKDGPKAFEVNVVEVDGNRLELAESLPVTVPDGSRIGYPNHIVALGKRPTKQVTLENLSFDGGRVNDIPMPGHAKRCAVWGAAPYTYKGGRQAPPLRDLIVRHCQMRNLYGRGVAFYNVADSEVIGCRIRNVDDEAIDFDHFNENCRALGNVVHNARSGLVLNDAYRCRARYNQFIDCGTGIRLWWWHKVSPETVNRHNIIEHNGVRNVSGAAIALGQNAFKNTVRYNFVDGPINVEENENTVTQNTQSQR